MILKNNLVRFGIACILLICQGACGVDKQDYVRYVTDFDNGLHVAKEFGAYNFDLQFTPPEYIHLQNPAISKEGLDALQYYTLTITSRHPKVGLRASEQEKQQLLYYLSYSFQQDLFVLENGEKLPCVLFHFERAKGLTDTKTFVLAFEKSKSHVVQEASLVISSDIFSALPISLTVDKQNIPVVSL